MHYTGENGKQFAFEIDLHFWPALLLLLLLILEIADRVVMKRDLQIAREIQTWLLPGRPSANSRARHRLCNAPRKYGGRRLL